MRRIRIISDEFTALLPLALKGMLYSLYEDIDIKTPQALAEEMGQHPVADTVLIFFFTGDAEKTIRTIQAVRAYCHTAVPVIVFNVSESTTSRDLAVFMSAQRKVIILNAGASLKELLAAIDRISDADWIPGPIARKEGSLAATSTRSDAAELIRFNKAERSIIACARKGYSISQTARELSLSNNTVATYRSKMIKRAGVKSMMQLLLKL